ncbi:hypothetical protein STVA_50620 [Allostella vacuolata]|nr:hypothetical protein STVA_50620 [Stella vacuolata]
MQTNGEVTSQIASPGDAIERARVHHDAGEFAIAARLYQDILRSNPRDVLVRRLLADLAHRAGQTEQAVKLLGQALELAPADAECHAALAEVLLQAGRRRQAEVHARTAAVLDPTHSGAQITLATALAQGGAAEEAILHWRRALELAPTSPAARQGFVEAKLAKDAVDQTERAAALFNSAHALTRVGRRAQALPLLARAASLAPNDPNIHLALGILSLELEDLEGADRALRRAGVLAPNVAAIVGNLGVALQEQGRMEEALKAFTAASRLAPKDVLAHWNRSLVLLRMGRWSEGLPEFEWRSRLPKSRSMPGTPWNGAPLNGRTLLLYGEQGLGDTIMCLRWLPELQARGGRIVLAVQSTLHRLVRATWPEIELVEEGKSVPAFDVQASLLGMLRLMAVRPDTLPPPANLAIPPNADIARVIGAAGSGRRIGLVWAGRPTHTNDHRRSCPPGFLAPLADVADCQWFSLQVPGLPNAPTAKAADLPPPLLRRTVDLAPHLSDMGDTAAALSMLDLVITIDSVGAHLAGSLGVPTWLMLPHVADWRWLEGRSDTPWYPSVRLFRQPRNHDWPAVIEAVARELNASG